VRDLIDLLSHLLVQHAKPDTHRQGKQPILRRAGQLPQRHPHAPGQRVKRPIADLVGIVLYGSTSYGTTS